MQSLSKALNYQKKLLKLIKPKNAVPDDPISYLKEFDYSRIKGIILAQEPYAYTCPVSFKPLAISTPLASICSKPPLTLRKLQYVCDVIINKKLGIDVKLDTELKLFNDWGILILNTYWTCELGKPNSHTLEYYHKGYNYSYEKLTSYLIRNILKEYNYLNIPILTMGRDAKNLITKLKDKNPNLQSFSIIHPAAIKYQTKINLKPLTQFLKVVQINND